MYMSLTSLVKLYKNYENVSGQDHILDIGIFIFKLVYSVFPPPQNESYILDCIIIAT